MGITYADYKKSGYYQIPGKPEFARYSDMAERKIKRFVKSFKTENDEAKQCIYEIADILYAEQNILKLSGFSNENCREQYFEGNNQDSAADVKIFEMLRLYFTNEELYRGV